MLNDLLANSVNKGVLWVGNRAEGYRASLKLMFDSCEITATSLDALCILEKMRLNHKAFPLVVVEDELALIDRDILVRALHRTPALAEIDVVLFGTQSEHIGLYTSIAPDAAAMNIAKQVILESASPSPVQPASFKSLSLRVLLIENKLTNRLIAHGLLKSLGVEHDTLDAIPADIDVEKYDLCLVAADLLQAPGNLEKLRLIKECIVMGDSNLPFKHLSVPLREKDLYWLVHEDESTIVEQQPINNEAFEANNETNIEQYMDLNIEEVKERLGVSDSILNMVLETYFNDLAKQINKLEEAIESVNPSRIKISAHTIKGSSSTMGFQQLSAFAADVEKQAAQDVSLGRLNDSTSAKSCELLAILKQFERKLAETFESEAP